MKILYVYGTEESKEIIYALRKMGYDAEEYPEVQATSILNGVQIDKLVDYIQLHDITHIMSIHLIYNLAVAAYKADIKYISIIWDAPYVKLYTPFGKLDNCWFSVFDKLDRQRFLDAGVPHILYQPLSVNEDDVTEWKKHTRRKLAARKYMNDVSFVGRLYEDNLYDEHLKELPPVIQNFFTSIFEEASFVWDGSNRIYGKTGKEVLNYIKLVNPAFDIENRLDIDDVVFFESQWLIRKVANIERIAILNTLAEEYDVSLYTISRVESGKLGKVKVKPPVLPGKDAAVIYAGSKINLNISLKGIEGGTPQRIMEIMGAGGFVLTNYCAETGELFEENKEIAMFRTPEELFEKVEYYLSHEEEREEIARAGHDKVLRCYTYEKKLKQLLAWVEE